MLTVFYIVVAVLTLFVILSLAVVRAHEKKRAETAERIASETPLPAQEEEFFSSPIYQAMEFIAHM